MPLCPQITITPITVTSSGMTQTSVVAANDPATTEQLSVTSAAAAEAAAAAATAESAAAAAAGVAAAAQADADAAQVEAAAANATAASAVSTANSAAAAAGAAQSTATTALNNAATAYNAAVASLQPSANTIVNASNQMTAIAANGITVYSGASASSGARVVLNSTGLAGFNSGGSATFSISATTGAAVFSGSVTGSTITGGTLNIAGNAIINASGLLTATGATITGTVNAEAGYFGTSTNGFSINSTGMVGVGGGTISGGTISGTTFTNGSTFSVTSGGFLTASNAEITGTIKATAGYFGSLTNGFSINSTGLVGVGTGTIVGGTISGATFINGGGTFSVTSAGVLTASSATITGVIRATSGYIGSESAGWNFTSTGFIRNFDGTTVFYPTSASNTYVLITDRSISSGGIQSSGDITTTGTARVTGQGTSANRCEFLNYNTINLHSISAGYGVDSDWSPNSDNTFDLGQATSAGAGANRRWRRLYSNNTTISTSDVNAKTDVVDSALGLDFINSLRPVGYRWIVGKQETVKDADGNPIVIGESPEGKPIFKMLEVPGKRLHYGFIAQEVKQAVDASGVEDFAGWVQDDLSNPDSTQSLSYEQFIAPMAKAIQELSARITQLEGA